MTQKVMHTTLLGVLFCLFAALVVMLISGVAAGRVINSTTIYKSAAWPVAPIVSLKPCKRRSCHTI